VPQLTGVGGKLPEASVSIKDCFFDIFCNEGHASTLTDDRLGVSLDAEGEVLFGNLEQALDSSPWMRVLWKRTDMDPAAAHAFNARGTTTGRLPQLAAFLVVTYTYDHDNVATTRLFRSLLVPMPTEAGAIGGTTSANQNKVQSVVPILEPGTITLEQSAVLLSFNAPNVAITGLNLAVGSQAHRAYTPQTANNSNASQHTVLHRFDAGAAAGPGMSLARGDNIITFGWYRTSSGSGSVGAGATALLVLNYTCDKPAAGAGAANHTTLWLAQATTGVGTTTVMDVAAFAPIIPEANYWVSSVGYMPEVLLAGRGMVTLALERQSGEGVGDGWLGVLAFHKNGASELEVGEPMVDATAVFQRHPLDPDTNRLALETSRAARFSTFLDPSVVNGGYVSLVMAVTYHSMTTSVTRALTGYTGDGSGITVHVFRGDTFERLYTAVSAIGGSYNFVAYDDVVDLFCVAMVDATHRGASWLFQAS
jgi:hypothetical protein